ncbi:hypothetical protein AGMMS49965_10470 [Bacteroidia bacterium]|nr:hypothetical protein AGMMS49965_10470 [Bacteroidia bacterium]
MTADTEIDIGQRIKQKLAAEKRTVAWLAEAINCDSSNLLKTLKNNYIYSDVLYKISIALGEDFFAFYSQKIAETLEKDKITSEIG